MLNRFELVVLLATAAQAGVALWLHRRLLKMVGNYELSVSSSFIKSVEILKKLDELKASVQEGTTENKQLLQEVEAKIGASNEPQAKDILYIGAAGYGTYNDDLRALAIQWNKHRFDGDCVVIDDEHDGMAAIRSAIGSVEIPDWQAGSLSVYAAIKDFLSSDYERMYYVYWSVLRDSRIELSRRRGMCHASVFSGGYQLTAWERKKRDTAIALVGGVDHFQWDQVLAHYVCLNKPMARDVIETLDRCHIDPMSGEFWARIDSYTATNIYADVLLEAYTMTSESPEIGNVFDVVSIAHAGQTEGRSWVYFANEACLQMRDWMKERENDERKS